MQDVMQHIYKKLERTESAANFSEYIEKSHSLKHLDDLYDETAVDIVEFWKHWGSQEVSIVEVFKKGRVLSRTISKVFALERKLE